MPAFKYKYPDLPSTPQPLLTKNIIENKPPKTHRIDFRCVKCQKVVVEADDIYFITNEAKGNTHGLLISVWAVYRKDMNVKMGEPYINPAKGLVYTLHCPGCNSKVGFLMRLSTQWKERNVQLAKFFYRKDRKDNSWPELLYPSLPGKVCPATAGEIFKALQHCEEDKCLMDETEKYYSKKVKKETWAKVPKEEKSRKMLATFHGIQEYLCRITKFEHAHQRFMDYMNEMIRILKEKKYFGLGLTLQCFIDTTIIRQCRKWLEPPNRPPKNEIQEIFDLIHEVFKHVTEDCKPDANVLSELIQGFRDVKKIQVQVQKLYEDLADPYLIHVWIRTELGSSGQEEQIFDKFYNEIKRKEQKVDCHTLKTILKNSEVDGSDGLVNQKTCSKIKEFLLENTDVWEDDPLMYESIYSSGFYQYRHACEEFVKLREKNIRGKQKVTGSTSLMVIFLTAVSEFILEIAPRQSLLVNEMLYRSQVLGEDITKEAQEILQGVLPDDARDRLPLLSMLLKLHVLVIVPSLLPHENAVKALFEIYSKASYDKWKPRSENDCVVLDTHTDDIQISPLLPVIRIFHYIRNNQDVTKLKVITGWGRGRKDKQRSPVNLAARNLFKTLPKWVIDEANSGSGFIVANRSYAGKSDESSRKEEEKRFISHLRNLVARDFAKAQSTNKGKEREVQQPISSQSQEDNNSPSTSNVQSQRSVSNNIGTRPGSSSHSSNPGTEERLNNANSLDDSSSQIRGESSGEGRGGIRGGSDGRGGRGGKRGGGRGGGRGGNRGGGYGRGNRGHGNIGADSSGSRAERSTNWRK
ncbi:hypothetical protein BKA69DRAFT_1170801 [Paraphysoderma sedebokerense]|nr:hypothetical protein BKA69DRAFT_1170801 [Paraphysoderma sedebokerense]